MEQEPEPPLPLNLCHANKSQAIINRVQAFITLLALAFLIYYRAGFFFPKEITNPNYANIPLLPWLLIFLAELLLSFIWLLSQALRWRPVTRTVFPERLPKDEKLPAIDVFVCTADPSKEPTINVMNTVISAMAMDYPVDKLNVYLSDDGGASVTLNGLKEAWMFAKFWLPFCNKYGVKTRCPEAYFSQDHEVPGGMLMVKPSNDQEFAQDRRILKHNYDSFKERVLRASETMDVENAKVASNDHAAFVQVIDGSNCKYDPAVAEAAAGDGEMPLLVYVSREKRPSRHTHFKAGALNVLLRVSAMISNAQYILVLDCDMFCNDPSSARQAMCFHLDPNISSSLAFVQFPQRFYNGSMSDIYDSILRTAFKTMLPGMDGLGGPLLCGTGFYMKRKALYGTRLIKDVGLKELRTFFGPSNEFIKSLRQNLKPESCLGREQLDSHLKELQFLASCIYEQSTKWGEEVGFLYHSVVEDYFTGFTLHCKGWISVYCDPERPQFLGTTTTNLNDVLVQGTRWYAGLTEVALSKYFPLIYGPSSMSVLLKMCYVFFDVWPLCLSCAMWFFASVPQLCLFKGIPLYPAMSSPLFVVVVFIFLSSLSKHMYEVLMAGGSIRGWCSEQRMWMIKSLTSLSYGSFDAIMKSLGVGQTSFIATNKVVDEQQIQRYQMGIYDFRTANVYLVPIVSMVILNFASFIGGVARVITTGSWDKMSAQLFLSAYILLMSFPEIEAMMLRKDSGCIPSSTTLISAVSCSVVLAIV